MNKIELAKSEIDKRNMESYAKIESVIYQLLPQKQMREVCLQMLVEIINYANSHGRDKWGIYYEKNHIRMLMGYFIIFTIEKGCVWLALDKDLINLSPVEKRLIDQSNDWKWDKEDYPEYHKIQSINGYYTPSERHPETWKLIKKIHFKFLDKVAAKYGQLRKSSQNKHDPDLIFYLRQVFGMFVPEPDYFIVDEAVFCSEFNEEIKKSQKLSQAKRRERLKSSIKKPETLKIIRTEFKRNPDVIIEVLERANGICEACGNPAPFLRASDGTPYLEVHHKISLADGGEDSVENAVALCPNCHRKQHFG
jgi:hypothetical protein